MVKLVSESCTYNTQWIKCSGVCSWIQILFVFYFIISGLLQIKCLITFLFQNLYINAYVKLSFLGLKIIACFSTPLGSYQRYALIKIVKSRQIRANTGSLGSFTESIQINQVNLGLSWTNLVNQSSKINSFDPVCLSSPV